MKLRGGKNMSPLIVEGEDSRRESDHLYVHSPQNLDQVGMPDLKNNNSNDKIAKKPGKAQGQPLNQASK